MVRHEVIGVIGLGYVGLPVALAFSGTYPVIGFDVNPERIAQLKACEDRTGEVDRETLRRSEVRFTDDPSELAEATFFVVTVPTPIDGDRRPDLRPVIAASETIGRVIRPGSVVVFESTVYPGVTEEICGPAIARVSGLTQGTDFKLGYSPERINPGDREHTIDRIVKVVSGEDAETLDRVADAYGQVIAAGIHRAPSIRAAEAAKVIENTQRDLNIALMNELAIIFNRLGIPTRDVLEAAATKWNFMRFAPGLVGGHCIGVDPYYLTAKAESTGYHPQVILAGRRINDGMGAYVAQQLIKLLAQAGKAGNGVRVGILGLTFKENVPDLRNSRVPDIVAELRNFGIEPLVHDPLADADDVMHEYGLGLCSQRALRQLDALVLAVPHRTYLECGAALLEGVVRGGIVMDVKAALPASILPEGVRYWAL